MEQSNTHKQKEILMQIKKFDGFEDVQSEKLPKIRGVIKVDGVKLRRISSDHRLTSTLFLRDKKFFAKRWIDAHSVQELATSKMYSDLGVVVPPVTLVKLGRDLLEDGYGFGFRDDFATMSQDVESVESFMAKKAKDVLYDKKETLRAYGKFKWEVLYNYDLKREFLKYMTPECLEDLINVFLLDELRTDNDRHVGNYFFVKKPGAEKYESVIPFDFEHAELLMKGQTNKKDGFRSFVYTPYESATPQGFVTDTASLKSRMETIAELVNDGVLSACSIELLKNALGYDFPKLVKKINRETGSKAGKEHYDAVSRLWEYNNQMLDKEL